VYTIRARSTFEAVKAMLLATKIEVQAKALLSRALWGALMIAALIVGLAVVQFVVWTIVLIFDGTSD
jgi:hypothetical protein